MENIKQNLGFFNPTLSINDLISLFHSENTGSIPVGRTSYLFIEINVLE